MGKSSFFFLFFINTRFSFHYYKKQLDKMDDPKEAYARRGAPFTFWAEGKWNLFVCIDFSSGLYQLLLKIKSEGEAKAPSFDHR
jgi:pantothenate kinase